MRVLFTTAPLSGHFFPLVPLAWACRALSHEVLVATSAHFIPTVLQAGLPAVPTGPGIAVQQLADPGSKHGIEDARYAHGQVFATAAVRNLAGTMAVVDSWRPDLVVSERGEFAGPLAAVARGIPRVELCWGVPELVEYRAAAVSTLSDPLSRLGLDRLPVPHLTLSPWPDSLRLPHAVDHAGLRHVPYDGNSLVPGWMLESGPLPRVCLTMGTVLPHLATRSLTGLLREMLDHLALLDCELVVAVDDEIARDLPPLPPAVRHAGRVPLSAVLRTCQLLIHHGGQGTALTALAVGCPQVVLPHFDDQIENADAVGRSGAGVVLALGSAAPASVAEHARLVLETPRYGAAASAVAREIAEQPSPLAVAAALEEIARTVPSTAGSGRRASASARPEATRAPGSGTLPNWRRRRVGQRSTLDS